MGGLGKEQTNNGPLGPSSKKKKNSIQFNSSICSSISDMGCSRVVINSIEFLYACKFQVIKIKEEKMQTNWIFLHKILNILCVFFINFDFLLKLNHLY
jgi:hypothetical protein